MPAIDLATAETGSGAPLIVLHGLFGSKRNWAVHAKSLAPQYRVITADLRNHGDSPWHDAMDYTAMADDLAHLIQNQADGRAVVLGHSMGGKAAMSVALSNPDAVEKLIVVDIAPVVYKGGSDHLAMIRAMMDIDLATAKSRSEIDDALKPAVEDDVLRAFAMHNLTRDEHSGIYKWRPNLAVLETRMADMVGFPTFDETVQYMGPTLFIRGERSPYIREKNEAEIYARFPNARIATVADAGHWVHAENTAGFMDALKPFIAD